MLEFSEHTQDLAHSILHVTHAMSHFETLDMHRQYSVLHSSLLLVEASCCHSTHAFLCSVISQDTATAFLAGYVPRNTNSRCPFRWYVQ